MDQTLYLYKVQLGSIPGRGTTDVIFIMILLQVKKLAKKRGFLPL